MDSHRPNFRLLFNMNLGFWGVQVANGLQTANVSAIFESLGAEASQLPMLWLGAPLVGLLVQPVVGNLSDRTWNRWGRRQPYFMGGAVMGTLLLIALPHATYLWQAVTLYWLLQLALNVTVAPAKPFVGDLLPAHQHTLGYAVQGICISLGAMVASALPWLTEKVLYQATPPDVGISPTIEWAYYAGAALFLLSTAWTFRSVKEPDLHLESVESGSGVMTTIRSMGRAILTMPPVMRKLAWVQLFTWIGIYCIFLYLPTAIALNVLGAPNRQSPSYAHGIEWAGICIAFYNLICLSMSALIPVLSRWWGRVITHLVCLACGTVGLMSLLLVHSRYPILLSMVGVGIAWASIVSIPYALLMDELSEQQSGLYMGIFNGFVTLPQIVMSIGFGWVMRSLLQGNRLWALAFGGIALGVAALLTLRVPETRADEVILTPSEEPMQG